MSTKEKLNVYQRLAKARVLISETPIKKEGKNKFSNYDYFTPSQVIQLVSKACDEVGLLTVYQLTPLEGESYSGCLYIHNVDNPEEIIQFVQPTISPDIKATNAAQKIGGMVTYNERYLKMSAFDIADNNLDFDAQDNSNKAKKRVNASKKVLNEKIYKQMADYIADGNYEAVSKQLPNYEVHNKYTDALNLLIEKAKAYEKSSK